MSTYLYSRSGFKLESATSKKPIHRYDLLTFLGVAHRLEIDFLPITWQPSLDRIGLGTTAEIREASAHLQFSFAFKRPFFEPTWGLEYFESHLLPCLIAEVSTLGLRSIKENPNIVNLEGICWEVISWEGEQISRESTPTSWKGGIIPVLVFEKSSYGDLHQFMQGELGKNLDLTQKISICADIANAVAQMHFQGQLEKRIYGDLS